MAVLSRSMQAAAAAACCMVVAVLVVSSHQAGPTSLLAKVPLSAAASTMMWFQREHPRTAKVMGERGLVQSALKATEEVKQYGGLEAAPTPALSSVAQQQLTVQDLPANWFSGGVALSGKEWGSVLGGALERANSLTRAKLVASRAAIGPEARCDQQSHCTEQGLYSRILSIPAVHQGGECPADVECELHQVFLPCHSNAEEEMEDPVRKEALCPLYVFASPAPSMAAAHTATLRARAAPKERSAVEHGATRPTQQAAPLVSRDTTDAGTLQGSRGKYVYPQDGKHYFGEYAPAGKGATLRSKAHDSGSGRDLPGVNVYGSVLEEEYLGTSAARKKVVSQMEHSRNVFAPQDGAKPQDAHSVSKELWHMLYDQKQEKPSSGHLPGVQINNAPGIDKGFPNPFGSVLSSVARTTELASLPQGASLPWGARTQRLHRVGLGAVLTRREGAAGAAPHNLARHSRQRSSPHTARRSSPSRMSHTGESVAAEQAAVLKANGQALLKDFFEPEARTSPARVHAGPRDHFVSVKKQEHSLSVHSKKPAQSDKNKLPGVNLWGFQRTADLTNAAKATWRADSRAMRQQHASDRSPESGIWSGNGQAEPAFAAPTQQLALPFAAVRSGAGALFADARARAPSEPRIDYSTQRDDAFASFHARDGNRGDSVAPCRHGDASLCSEERNGDAVVEVGGRGAGRRALVREVRREGGVPLQKLGMDIDKERSDEYVPYEQGQGREEERELGDDEDAAAQEESMDAAEGREAEEEEAHAGEADEEEEANDGAADQHDAEEAGEDDSEEDGGYASAAHKELIPDNAPPYIEDTPLHWAHAAGRHIADLVQPQGKVVDAPRVDTIMNENKRFGALPGVLIDSLGPLTTDAGTRPIRDNSYPTNEFIPDDSGRADGRRIPSDQSMDDMVGSGSLFPKSQAWKTDANEDDVFAPAPGRREHNPAHVSDGCVDNDGDYLC